MPLLAPKTGKEFAPAATGLQQGVIAKVTDLGISKKEYAGEVKDVHEIQLIWQVTEKDESGEPKRVYETFTFSNHEKAKLRKRMINLFGKPAPDDFDYEKLVGLNRNLVLVHTTSKKGRTYANVDTTMRLNPNQAKLDIIPFELRKKEGVQQVKTFVPMGGIAAQAAPITDDDLPF
jgi:hypothetical protein